jgi:alkylation response protein AidB-like acyl-CoA dehydrogenase
MNFEFTPEERLFREEVRGWLADNVPREKRPPEGPAMRDFDLGWQRRKYEGGWGGIAWPQEYGGRGLSTIQQIIWFEECGRAHAPALGTLNVAMSHAGPTIALRGNEEQKKFHLPKILKGEAMWCQGFSEPNAGSDLAGIKCTGIIDGDEIVINGTKIWTSNAQLADFQETLIRTDPESKRHKGLTWLILDMNTPGLDIRTIDTMVPGNQHFAQVFYNDVRVPLSNVVGDVNEGWKVAMSTLTFERGSTAAAHAMELSEAVEDLIALARVRIAPNSNRPVIENGDIAMRLSMHRSHAASIRAMLYETASRNTEGPKAGAEAAVTFLLAGELTQALFETAMDILGADGLEYPGGSHEWTRHFLFDRIKMIAGGTAEVRRNIIAERGLGLPRSY